MRATIAYFIFYVIAICLVLNLFGINDPDPDTQCTKEDYHDTH
jgi:hypothetical protein